MKQLSQARVAEIQAMWSELPALTHFQVLGISPGATPKEIRAAYHRAVKKWHPDTAFGVKGDLGQKLNAIFEKVEDAYRNLKGKKLDDDRA